MNEQRPGMFISALIGGGIAGLLAGIPLVSCLCCLWIIGGGIISVYFLAKDSSVALGPGDGAIVGAFSGIIAAVVELLISIPLSPLENKLFKNLLAEFSEYIDEMPAGFESIMDNSFEAPLYMLLLGLVISVVIFSALGALGGIIGIAMFKNRSSKSSQGVIDVPKDSIKTENSDNSKS